MTGEAGGTMPSRRLELVPPDELKAALADGIRAQHEAGDLQASPDSFERAYRLAERSGDAESMALAALGLAGLWVAERRTVTSTVLLEARLQHVLALLDPRSVLALRVRTRLAGEADYARGTHASVLAALDEVRTLDDPELLAEARRIAHPCLLGLPARGAAARRAQGPPRPARPPGGRLRGQRHRRDAGHQGRPIRRGRSARGARRPRRRGRGRRRPRLVVRRPARDDPLVSGAADRAAAHAARAGA